MYTNEYMRRRKAVARLLAKMAYEPQNAQRNLSYVHRRFVVCLLGIDYDTFLDYLNEDKDRLEDVVIPNHIILGLWEMIRKAQNNEAALPVDLMRKLHVTAIPRRRYTRRRADTMSEAR